jgi:hypothetical protein
MPSAAETSEAPASPPPPPAKGYDLSFLDKLDDPNFNPFQTKTAVANTFDTSSAAPPPSTESIAGEIHPNKSAKEVPPPDSTANTETVRSSEKKSAKPPADQDKPPKKALPPKPWLKKKSTEAPSEESNIDAAPQISESAPPKPLQKKKPVAPAQPPTDAGDEMSEPIPAKGAYNLDFLDQLDDASFNPFQTKSRVANVVADNSLPVPATSVAVVGSEEVADASTIADAAHDGSTSATDPLSGKRISYQCFAIF